MDNFILEKKTQTNRKDSSTLFLHPKEKGKKEQQNTVVVLPMISRHQCYLNITFRKICIVRKCLVKNFFSLKKDETSTQNADKHQFGRWRNTLRILNQYFKIWTFISSKESLKNVSFYIKLAVYLLLKDFQSTEWLLNN